MTDEETNRDGPFQPDVGMRAPCLAGREHEVGVWRRHLARMRSVDAQGRERKPVGSIVLMYGPRGMGKTALLMELESMAAHAGGIGVVRRQASAFKDGPDILAAKLLAQVGSPTWRTTSATLDAGVNVGVFKGGGTETQVFHDPKDAGDLTDRLREQCRAGPVVALIDEAHAIEGEDGLNALQALVNAGQVLVTDNPFLLVLAGTPGLQKTLHDANCSFIWQQKGKDVALGVGRLEPEAARKAICAPLEEKQWQLPCGEQLSIDESALDEVLQASQGFPYFLQQWGQELWAHAVRSGRTRLGQEDVDAVKGAVAALRTDFYEEQGAELRNGFLPRAAMAVADAFRDAKAKGQPVSEGAAHTAISEALEPVVPEEDKRTTEATNLLKELKRLGFCWRPPRTGHLIAGIPSFMDYARTICPPLSKPPPIVIDKNTKQAFTLGDLTGMDGDDPKCILTPAGAEPGDKPIEAPAASLTAFYKGVDPRGQALLEQRQADARESLGTEGPPGPNMDGPTPGR